MPDQQQWVDALQSGGANFGTMSPQEQAPSGTVQTLINLLRGGYQGIEDTAKGAIGAADTYAKTGEYDAKPVVDAALLAAGGASPFAEAGAAGMFGGRLAQEANHRELLKAQLMGSAGRKAPEIYKETGWFQGADGKWRFEIPDQTTQMKGVPREALSDVTLKIDPDKKVTVGDIFEHRPLYNNYPNIQRIKAFNFEPADKSTYAIHKPNIPLIDQVEQIGLRPNIAPELRGTLLHELQHSVQDAEGFAPGAMVSNFLPQVSKIERNYKEAKSALADQLNSIGETMPRADALVKGVMEGKPLTPGHHQALMKLMESGTFDKIKQSLEVQRLLKEAEDKRWTMYRNQAGEVESRNVQTRMDMSTRQRMANPPWETQDIPYSEQLLGNNPIAASMLKALSR